jgi:gliding motility-associated-like protein
MVADALGCRNFTIFNINPVTSVPPSLSGTPLMCSGSTVNLTASGAVSYTWSTGATTSVIAVSPSVTTSYTVNVTDFRGCKGKSAHTVSVLPSPKFTVNNATICAGGSATLTATGVSPDNTQFFWSPGNIKGATVIVSPGQTTTYQPTGHAGGCSVTKIVHVNVNPTYTPSTTFSYYMPLCTKHADALPDTIGGFHAGGFYSSTGEGGYAEGLLIDSATGKVNLQQAPAGTYLVRYTVPGTTIAALGCTATASGTAIVAIIEPTPLILSPDISITEGESTKLTAGGGESYQWSPPEGLNCIDCHEVIASPTISTSYCVSGISNGCYSAGCINVEVTCHNNNDFSVPNAFTPNRDGRNDRLCLQGWERCNDDFNIKIFNRWGEMVFESDKTDFCWDGTFNGVLLDADVYAYFIKAKFRGDAPIIKGGNITLLR